MTRSNRPSTATTKPYKFIGFGAMDATKPYEFIGFGAMDATKPYKFIGFGAMDVTPVLHLDRDRCEAVVESVNRADCWLQSGSPFKPRPWEWLLL